MWINFNGKIIEEAKACISPSNRSFRYGDGFFETMKMVNNKIILQELHLNRLFYSLEALQFEVPAHFTPAYISTCIHETAKKNNLETCRVRLAVFRGDGGLYDPASLKPNFIIQAYKFEYLPTTLNSNGLVIDIFRDSIKAADRYSSIKSNNFLPYVMAALWVKKQNLNDALLINQLGTIADSTIANVFIIGNGSIKTPSLHDGAIDGVMRRYLLNCLRKDNMPVQECPVTVDDLNNASEVFLTNAIHNIRWVKQAGSSQYSNDLTTRLYTKYIAPLHVE